MGYLGFRKYIKGLNCPGSENMQEIYWFHWLVCNGNVIIKIMN